MYLQILPYLWIKNLNIFWTTLCVLGDQNSTVTSIKISFPFTSQLSVFGVCLLTIEVTKISPEGAS